MKKISAIVLLILMLFQLLGYYMVFQIQLADIQLEMKHRIKNNPAENTLTRISFALHETGKIKWEKQGKEFLLHNTMFDVVKTKTSKDSITYYCIADIEETELLARMDDYISTFMASHPDKHKKTNQLLKQLGLEYAAPVCIIPKPGLLNNSAAIFFYTQTTYLVFQGIASPPPRFV